MLARELHELLDLSRWSRLDKAERRRAMDGVTARLDGRVRPTGVKRFTLGDQSHDIALFACEDLTMALVPGGEVALGWDHAPVRLSAKQRAGWLKANDSGLPTFEAMLEPFMTKPRRVRIAPFLAQVEPTKVSDLIDDLDEEEKPQAAVQDALKADGFLLPTTDQWEHVCRAGSSSFFRWGDKWPDGEPYGNETKFKQHRSRTAFGLVLSSDPYFSECIRGGKQFRGGDGGAALCGGRPEPEAWYSFASAFALPRAHVADCLPETLETGFVRRILEL